MDLEDVLKAYKIMKLMKAFNDRLWLEVELFLRQQRRPRRDHLCFPLEQNAEPLRVSAKKHLAPTPRRMPLWGRREGGGRGGHPPFDGGDGGGDVELYPLVFGIGGGWNADEEEPGADDWSENENETKEVPSPTLRGLTTARKDIRVLLVKNPKATSWSPETLPPPLPLRVNKEFPVLIKNARVLKNPHCRDWSTPPHWRPTAQPVRRLQQQQLMLKKDLRPVLMMIKNPNKSIADADQLLHKQQPGSVVPVKMFRK